MNQNLTIEFKELQHWNQLDKADIELVNRAFEIAKDAYAPYSKFTVGASLRMDDDSILVGSNQENLAYPSGLCAERVALFYAGSNFPTKKVLKICVVAKGELVSGDSMLSPCGGCRQVMAETQLRQKMPIEVILVSQSNKTLIFKSIQDLLPFTFGL